MRDDLNSPNTINPLPTRDVYLVTERDEEGYKIKTTWSKSSPLRRICAQ
jgi:hypothetical protein